MAAENISEFINAARVRGANDEAILSALSKSQSYNNFIADAQKRGYSSSKILSFLQSRGDTNVVAAERKSVVVKNVAKETGKFFFEDILGIPVTEKGLAASKKDELGPLGLGGAFGILTFTPRTIAREIISPFVQTYQGIKELTTGKKAGLVKLPFLGNVGAPESPKEAFGRATTLTAAAFGSRIAKTISPASSFARLRGAQRFARAGIGTGVVASLLAGGEAARKEKPSKEIAVSALAGFGAGTILGGVVRAVQDSAISKANTLIKESATRELTDDEIAHVGKQFKEASDAVPDDVEEAVNLNLKKWQSLGPKKVTTVVSESIRPQLEEGNRYVMSASDIDDLAKSIGIKMTPKEAAKIAAKHANLAEEIRAVKLVHGGLSKNVDDALREGIASDWSPSATSKFRTALTQFYEYTPSVSRVTAEWGRAGTAFKGIVDSKPATDLVSKVGSPDKMSDQTLRAIGSYLQMLSAGEGPKATSQAAYSLMERGTLDNVVDFWVGTRLLNPLTHSRNISGNTLHALTTDFERTTAGTYDTVISRLQGRERELFASDGIHSVQGRIDASRAVLKTITEAIKMGKSPADALIERWPALSASRYVSLEEVIPDQAIARGAMRISKAPGVVLQYEDLVFRAMAYEGSMRAQASRAAAQQFAKGAIDYSRYGEIVDDLTNNPTIEMIRTAQTDAADDVFQAPLGSFGKDLNNIRIAHPTTRFVVPFFKTLVNIGKFQLRRFPILGLLTPSERAALAAGGEGVSEVLARQTTGVLVATALAGLVTGGYITGRGPKSRNERAALERTGWRPYSVKIGDNYVSLRGFDPISTPAASVADAFEIWKAGELEEEPASERVMQIVFSMMKNFGDQPFLLGVDRLLDAVQEPERFGGRYAFSFLGGFFGNPLLGAVARTIDPIQRRPTTLAEHMIAPIPGASRFVSPSLTPFGEEKRRKGPLFSGLVLPQASVAKEDDIDKEMQRLNYFVGYPGSTGPRGIHYSKDEVDIILTISGPMIKEALSTLIADSNYEELADEDKVKVWRRVIDAARDNARLQVIPFAEARRFGITLDAETEVEKLLLLSTIFASKEYGKLDEESQEQAFRALIRRLNVEHEEMSAFRDIGGAIKGAFALPALAR